MPSAFAHAAVGMTIGCALPRDLRFRRGALAVFAAAAAAPDLDVIGFQLGVPYASPFGHRGVTHSIGFAVGLALVSLPLWRLAFGRRWVWGAGLGFLVVASHGILDAFTDAGLGVALFLPFDGERYFAPWRPITTSPLSVRRFFSERGWEIVQSEARWIGIPCLLYLSALGMFRRLRMRPRCREE